MKIKVLNRKSFILFTPLEPAIAISITDPNSKPVETMGKYKSILSLQFHDLDRLISDNKIALGCQKPYIYFNTRMAEDVLKFVQKNTGMIVIHCEAGISRSAGVASALSLIYNGEDQYYFDHYLPNMLVYRKILNAYFNA